MELAEVLLHPLQIRHEVHHFQTIVVVHIQLTRELFYARLLHIALYSAFNLVQFQLVLARDLLLQKVSIQCDFDSQKIFLLL